MSQRIGAITGGSLNGARLPVLFLHGVGSDKRVWAPQLAHFGPRRGAIAADYPGYGDSAFVADATRTDYAEAMVDLLDRLEIERAHVCGLSLGGIIALEMARHAPARVAGLVIADSFARHPDGTAIYDRSVEAASTIGMAALAAARVDHLLGSDPPPGLREEVIETMAAIDPAAYRLGARAVWCADLREAAPRIPHPALVLCGSEDAVTPPALSDALAALLPTARRADIAGAGHLANAERPGEFNALVEDFLAELDT
ncbi:alpha/beta fold hydrolase [Sphingomicrobium astaxanthinifaciens]|uniref:alpha/beta fold hydrolase n=1 Tax=Sphingomicrobium astaxanthinifaciens TaxID=1227949 RepID=UPI001FCAC4C1|nr:alpha/beta fold hydrolase [Sphingomicrobium astaxanthinifaciens]MCJ7420927.1 alpha/beta hydrolase [Sphingomicrobium astaxanthinifaciens]